MQDLDSASGTKLNGNPLQAACELESGDVVAVGAVEFMVLLMREGEVAPTTKEERAVTDWIEEADDQARQQRQTDPDSRAYTVPEFEAQTIEEIDEKQALVERLRQEKKAKPKKLPVDELKTESSTSAAEQILKKMMAPPKSPGQ